MTEQEKEIEAKLRKRVEALGGKCPKWTSPGNRGVPDRIVLMPGGRKYFVETKRPKDGKLSPLQKKWHKWLTELGFSVWTVWSLADLADFIEFIETYKGAQR